MIKKNLKVFHGFVNYGTQAGLLARELNRNNVKAVSVIINDPYKRVCDISISFSKNRLRRWIQKLIFIPRKINWFFKYNTFHYYFGKTLFRHQWDLPFYRLFGKKVIMEHLGGDIRNYKLLVERYNLPDNHQFAINMDIHDLKVKKRIAFEDKYLDYRLVCLPSHFDMVKADDILPLGLDIGLFHYTSYNPGKIIKILHAPTNRSFKGTSYIVNALEKLKREGHPVSFKIVENVTHSDLKREYEDCDLFIDQISTGWYGTAALEAMALGRPVCAFMDEEYFKFIDYSQDIPVININRDSIYEVVKNLIYRPDLLKEYRKKGRAFVEQYHDIRDVTHKLMSIYQKIWNIR